MKRTLVGLATLAIAISSCTNNELIEGVQSPDNAIDYAPYVGRATRAASMTLDKLDKFRVVAYGTEGAYATAVAFTANGYAEDVTLNSGTWAGEKTRYWPEEPELMSFFAYSPKDAGRFTEATAGGYPSLAFSVDATPASQVDLLGAVMMDQTRKSDNKNVAFNLKHLLTQVTFKAKAGSTAYTVKVKSIKINKVNPEGTFTYDGSATVGTWGTTSGTPADYTYVEHTDITTNTDTPAGSETAEAVAGENLMLIPSVKGSLTGVEMEVVYQCYKAGVEPLETLGVEITKTVTLTDQDEWAMGKKVSYVMLLHRQSGPIVFEAEIEDWADETPQDKEVNDIFNTTELSIAQGAASIQPIEITNRAGVDAAFTLTSSEPWLKISANSDGSGAMKDYAYTPITRAIAAKTTLYLVTEYNGTGNNAREATLTWAREGAKSVVLKVTQAAMSEDKAFGDVTEPEIAGKPSSAELTVYAVRAEDLSYTLESNSIWLTISDKANNAMNAKTAFNYTPGSGIGPKKYYLYVSKNGNTARTATITIKNRAGMVEKTLNVTQLAATDPYFNTNETSTGIGNTAIKWAGSNIYWDGTKLAFDDYQASGRSTNAMVQGLMFKWGSLVALKPLITGTWNSSRIVFKPSEYTNTPNTHANVPYLTEQLHAEHTPQVSQYPYFYHNPATGIGDICRYMTEKGWAPGATQGKKWRMPTRAEHAFNESQQKAVGDPVAKTSWEGATVEAGKGVLSFGYELKSLNVVFPVSGEYDPASQNLKAVNYDGRRFDGSPATNEIGNEQASACQTYTTAQNTCYYTSRNWNTSIRCILDEDYAK